MPTPERAPAAGTTGRLLVLAALVLAFVVFYPYLEATDSCGDAGCPHLSHASYSVELPAGLAAAALLAFPAAPLAGRARRRPVSDRKPDDLHLSPEPEPPRS